jgi:hypothetical protein
MAQHHFEVGDRVRIVRTASATLVEAFTAPPASRRDTPTVWTVVRLIPPDARGPQYHVHADCGTSRAVHESEIDEA